MKRIKLDEIKHNAPFKAPDGYFEGLAHKIQGKAINQEKRWGFDFIPLSVRVAVPAFVIVLFAVVLWPTTSPSVSAEEILSEVSTEAIIDYLYTSDITSDELMENYDFEEATENEQDLLLNDDNIDSAELERLLQDYEITGEYL